MLFKYVAYSLEQGIVKGQVKARAEHEARAQIVSYGYRPLKVKPLQQQDALARVFPSLQGVKTAELVRFCRNMSAMLTSGGDLVRAIEMILKETRSANMRRILEEISRTLDEGGSFSMALAAHPLAFNPLFVSVVEVGEYTGRLGPALEEMGEILQKDEEAKQKAIRTLLYPMAIIGLSLMTLVILMTFALPPMVQVFERMGTNLPLITRITIGTFNGVRDHILQIAGGILTFIVAVSLLQRITAVRYRMDKVKTRLPLLGPLIIAKEMNRFARTVAMLLGSGVPLSSALQLGIKGAKSLPLKYAFQEAEESLLSGHGLSAALKKHPIIPNMFVELVMIGEASNSLTRTMNDAAITYQKQLEQRLNSLLGMLEPVSTLIVGGMVGVIALSMFVPIYASLNSFK